MLYDFEYLDDSICQKIAFKQVTENDDELIHKWMNEEHVHPFWNLNITLKAFKSHLKKALADKHQSLYLGFLDGQAVSYWEAYWVKGDVVEKAYTAHPYDQGVHLLLGEKRYLGKGYSLPLLRAMVRFQFQVNDTKKIVAEPDIRNEKMIHVFKKCGFKPIKPIELPDKTGLLMFCERKEFEGRWQV
ncbi:GNAT family N-acetyltransferase [Alteribacter keqinensis]|uniref:Lysine N-acyltransferase MbtK n=1 Tax=Alteribacter keqinensis TaxID=2483800 RepID=A0A3M7TW76_9BACI|nr:GNAT family N-acetyltransferase [Alteribacter keqinensis]RNA69733.1 N-acetyltransferase [Alteribacter keqinensis]